MNEVIREWIAKAEGDYATASREFRVQDGPNYDAVCFHAQQCAEKYLKALLIEKGVTPPKIHDLVDLSRRLQPVCDAWDWNIQELQLLSRSAVLARYPGESAGYEEAEAAFEICRRVRKRLRELLGLSE